MLQALAVADNAFLLLWLGHYPLHSSGRFDQLPKSFHTVMLYLRVYTFPLLYMAQTQTIWLTVAVALNRFTAVCFPYRAHRYHIVTSASRTAHTGTALLLLLPVPRTQVPHCYFCSIVHGKRVKYGCDCLNLLVLSVVHGKRVKCGCGCLNLLLVLSIFTGNG